MLEWKLKRILKKLDGKEYVEFNSKIFGQKYRIIVMNHDKENGININSILAIPCSNDFSEKLVMESNNDFTNMREMQLKHGLTLLKRIVSLTDQKPGPILIPLIPEHKDGQSLQHLSRDSFDIPKEKLEYRIDIQVAKTIEKAKKIIKSKTNKEINEKIFLNGYSCSGVFAQRFALLYPELIDTLCVGGASGSIPIPSTEFDYPIGIGNYKTLMGKDFDFEKYSQIKFRYYVGEFEDKRKSDEYKDENGEPAPMHDMSYNAISVPKQVGEKQRQMLGKNLFERIENTLKLLTKITDIDHTIIKGRSHNNKSGIGVNELGDAYVRKSYEESLKRERDKVIL